MHMPAKDMCAYGRALLDVLFSKEQARSVLVKTPKSSKPPLAPQRVQLLFGKILCVCFMGGDSNSVRCVLHAV